MNATVQYNKGSVAVKYYLGVPICTTREFYKIGRRYPFCEMTGEPARETNRCRLWRLSKGGVA
jgi:hypothetical protein